MKGRCPFAVWRGDDGMGGYPAGTPDQNRPLIFVDHIMAGWKSVMDSQWRINARVDVTFGIGRDGSLAQYTNIFDAHWGNGVAGATSRADRRAIVRYDRTNRHLKTIEDGGNWVYLSGVWWLAKKGSPGVSALNAASIATEHEGFPFDRAGFDATWLQAMIDMSVRTKRWTIEEFRRYGWVMPPVDDDLLVRHGQIDAINRPNCPGPEWPKSRILAALKPATMPPDERDDDMKYIRFKGEREVFALAGGVLIHVPNGIVMDAQTGSPWPVDNHDKDDPDPAKRKTARELLGLPTSFNKVPKVMGGL